LNPPNLEIVISVPVVLLFSETVVFLGLSVLGSGEGGVGELRIEVGGSGV